MTEAVQPTLADHLTKVFALDPEAVAVEFAGGGSTWRDLALAGDEIARCLEETGVPPDAVVGWVARNRPGAIAAFAALVRAYRTVAPVRPSATMQGLIADLEAQRFAVLIGDDDDWSQEAVAAAAALGMVGISVSGASPIEVRLLPQLATLGTGPFRGPMPGVVMERLTSGTTGPPKRIPVTQAVLLPALKAGEGKRASEGAEAELKLKRSPAILLKPFSHAGGLFGLLLALYQARPMVLFEKFVVSDWVHAIERYRPKSANLVPAMIQMILEADVPKASLGSLLGVRAGTAPLDPFVQETFEARYGVPILIDYGAAEFIGGVAGWGLADHQKHGVAKRGSVGRAKDDVQLRIVAPDTQDELPAGETGLLEIRSIRFGPDWIRTNDLAEIDADGFLFLRGRADDAINRGGFKILPDDVAAVLRRFPGVRDCAVIGMPDARLGEVPVAAIELADGASLDKGQLATFAREYLAPYMIPVRFEIVGALPRTPSLKVSRPELRAMMAEGL